MAQKLNIRFHNPNTAEVTAEFLAKLVVEAGKSRLERALQEQLTYVEAVEAEEDPA